MAAMSLHSGGTGDLETGDFKHSPISQKAPVEHISDAWNSSHKEQPERVTGTPPQTPPALYL